VITLVSLRVVGSSVHLIMQELAEMGILVWHVDAGWCVAGGWSACA